MIHNPAILQRSVFEIDHFSIRAANHLNNLPIKTVGDLIQWSAQDIYKSRSFSRKNVREFRRALAMVGLRLRNDNGVEDVIKALTQSPFKPFYLIAPDGSRIRIENANQVELQPEWVRIDTPEQTKTSFHPAEIIGVDSY